MSAGGSRRSRPALAGNSSSEPVRAGRALLAVAAINLASALTAGNTSVPGYSRLRRATVATSSAARVVLWALGVTVAQHGRPRPEAALVVANDPSWLSALALLAASPMSPVAEGGLLGPALARLVRRAEPPYSMAGDFRTDDVVHRVTATLRRGHRVLSLLPFGQHDALDQKTANSVLHAAIDSAVVVNPVAVRYHCGCESRFGTPLAPSSLGHTREFLRNGPVSVELTWLPPIPAIVATGDRELDHARLAAAVDRAIASSLGEPSLHGSAHRFRAKDHSAHAA